MTDLTIRRDPRHGNQYYIAGYHGTFFSTEADAWAACRLVCQHEAERAAQSHANLDAIAIARAFIQRAAPPQETGLLKQLDAATRFWLGDRR